jgi:hypothetical protein
LYRREAEPVAVLYEPVELSCSAKLPFAVLFMAVVFEYKDCEPAAVF